MSLSVCVNDHESLYLNVREALKKQAENGLQSRSSENGKTGVWHYGLILLFYLTGDTECL